MKIVQKNMGKRLFTCGRRPTGHGAIPVVVVVVVVGVVVVVVGGGDFFLR